MATHKTTVTPKYVHQIYSKREIDGRVVFIKCFYLFGHPLLSSNHPVDICLACSCLSSLSLVLTRSIHDSSFALEQHSFLSRVVLNDLCFSCVKNKYLSGSLYSSLTSLWSLFCFSCKLPVIWSFLFLIFRQLYTYCKIRKIAFELYTLESNSIPICGVCHLCIEAHKSYQKPWRKLIQPILLWDAKAFLHWSLMVSWIWASYCCGGSPCNMFISRSIKATIDFHFLQLFYQCRTKFLWFFIYYHNSTCDIEFCHNEDIWSVF